MTVHQNIVMSEKQEKTKDISEKSPEKERLIREYDRTFLRQVRRASDESRLIGSLYLIAIILAWLSGGAVCLVLYQLNQKYGILLPYLYIPLTVFAIYIWGRARDESLTKAIHILTALVIIGVSALSFFVAFSGQ